MIRTMAGGIIDALLRSEEPSIRWTVRTRVLGEPADSPANRRLRGQIRRSPRVRRLLDADFPRNLYAKWRGAHWVLATLADLGYPPGDEALLPLLDGVLDRWLHQHYFEEFEASGRAASYRGRGVAVIAGRYRHCGSLQGNALRFAVALGLADERAGRLAERLRHWQWPDGGWNCDKKASGRSSSFHESLPTMWGLHEYAAATGAEWARDAAERTAEMFLEHRLFRSLRTGQVLRDQWLSPRQPPYWHYDILQGLLILSRMGRATDARAADALEVLESLRDRDGRWAARGYWWKLGDGRANSDVVDWGRRGPNELLTLNALRVFAAAESAAPSQLVGSVRG
jgi:hypothetical protein